MTINTFDPLAVPGSRPCELAAGFRPLVFGAPSSTTERQFTSAEQPRETVAWQPLILDPPCSETAPSAHPQDADGSAELDLAVQAAREEGMRAGLAALDAYKRNHANAMTERLEAVCAGLQQRFDALEQTLAERVADVALALARQVVRDEIGQRPELLATVAREALDTLMTSARHIVLRVHPDDHELVARDLQERLAAQDIRLVPDAELERGDCRVESDLGSVDARVATRWRRAAAAMGRDSAWQGEDDFPASGAPA